jgi:type IV secretion system protein VirB9
MVKYLGVMIVILFVSGCASPQPIDTKNLYTPTRIVEKETYIKSPVNKQSFQLSYGNDPALQRVFNQYISTGKAANIITEGFTKFAYNSGQQVIVKTNPGHQTIISLEPGERFTNVTTGDPSKWTYSAAMSGSGKDQQTHILVVPLYSDISTNMVITTDKRMYNINLVSSMDGKYTKNVRFWYPEEMVNTWNDKTYDAEGRGGSTSAPDVNVTNLNFDYRISSGWSSSPSWTPTRIFDDGKQTFIQFPQTMSTRDMPVLFIVDGKNQRALVNYRWHAPYFIVDRVFKEAVLVMGTGGSQQQLRLTNRKYL